MRHVICTFLLSAVAAAGGAGAAAPLPTPKPERVAEIAAMLPEKPAGYGAKLSDRAAWQAVLREHPKLAQTIAGAAAIADEPFPEIDEDLFMVFRKTGQRAPYEQVYFQRIGRIGTLAFAECLEGKGRFIKPLEDILTSFCRQKTWVLPSVDKKLTDYRGETVTIELRTADISFMMGNLLWVFGDALSPKVRALMQERTRKWVIDPHMASIRGERDAEWWYRCTNNWNAVCLAGTTGGALTMVESRQDRALAIAAAEMHIQHFLDGFTKDGYCTEGLGYWNYGYGHFIMLSEVIYQATGGKIDLAMQPRALAPARFPLNIEILDGTYPAIADCPVNALPSNQFMHYLSRKHGWGLREYEKAPMARKDRYFSISCLFSFPNSASKTPPAEAAAGTLSERSWFSEAGILVSRPAPGSGGRFAAAMKGGHNAEHHNHNDVGSYVVVSNGDALLLDPGGERYTARTFSPQRYESQVLNSYGHPVPYVAGKLQRKGKDARAKILDTEFGEATDELKMDLKACYDVPELKSLTRTFVYRRAAPGALEVTDEVEFLAPCDFGTAFVTLNAHRIENERQFIAYTGKGCVRVSVATEGGPTEWKVETMQDGKNPTRVGLNFAQPVTKARIVARIVPIEVPEDAEGVYRTVDLTGVEFDEASGVTVEAEDFVAEEGGKVNVCPKVGASGMAFKFWREAGHALSWKVDVPRDGTYAIMLRQCQNHDVYSQFNLLVDGEPQGKNDGLFIMPTTGGWAGANDDWESHWIGQGGKLLTVDLEKGEHVVKIVNANGRGVNLDYVRVVPLAEK